MLLTVHASQITCLFDMDIVFQPDGDFTEVYLYVRRAHFIAPPLRPLQEELMEADLHAIVRPLDCVQGRA